MNSKRLIVLGFALVAATGAALLARSAIGGGTPKVDARPVPPPIAMSNVLVANSAIQPGQKLLAENVRWQKWPSSSVDSGFITEQPGTQIADVVNGTVVRSPLISGQPITNDEIVHTDAAGFMAAMIAPGMRAVSITITADSGAGGFILPNDRVDLILTAKSNDSPPRATARTILSDIRVLAVDQTFKQDKDTKTVIGKTATLELTPQQALIVERAQNQGLLSLSLRPLGDGADALAANMAAPPPAPDDSADDDVAPGSSVAIIRYGVPHGASGGDKDKAQ